MRVDEEEVEADQGRSAKLQMELAEVTRRRASASATPDPPGYFHPDHT